MNNLNISNASLENKVNELKSETNDKTKKINTLESELAEANKTAINAKAKYESLQEKLEREFNGKNVKKYFYLFTLFFYFILFYLIIFLCIYILYSILYILNIYYIFIYLFIYLSFILPYVFRKN
jgi:hypothetical protein